MKTTKDDIWNDPSIIISWHMYRATEIYMSHVLLNAVAHHISNVSVMKALFLLLHDFMTF